MWRSVSCIRVDGDRVLFECADNGISNAEKTVLQQFVTKRFSTVHCNSGGLSPFIGGQTAGWKRFWEIMEKGRSSTRRMISDFAKAITSSVGFVYLSKPFVFAAAVTVTSFATAWICQYLWSSSLDTGHNVVMGIIAANIAVNLAWQDPSLSETMVTYFTSSPIGGAPCLSMLLATFSHSNGWHLMANMFALRVFAPVVIAKFGREEFVAIYLSAGVVASFAGYLHKVAAANMLPSLSLGASGAIMALVGIVGTLHQDSRFSIPFVHKIFPHSFSADAGLKALIAVDTVGVLLGWQFVGHAGHLGGMLFGIWYAKYGHRISRGYRDAMAEYLHDRRGRRLGR